MKCRFYLGTDSILKMEEKLNCNVENAYKYNSESLIENIAVVGCAGCVGTCEGCGGNCSGSCVSGCEEIGVLKPRFRERI